MTADTIAAEAKREKVDREASRARSSGRSKTRLAFVDFTVIPGLAAVVSPVLHWNGEAVSRRHADRPRPELAKASHPAAGALRRLCDRLSKDFGAKELKAVAWNS